MSEYKPRKGEADEKRRADEAHAKAKADKADAPQSVGSKILKALGLK